MKKYLVNINGFATWQTTIEARNMEEAREIAHYMTPEDFTDDHAVSFDDMEFEDGDIEEL